MPRQIRSPGPAIVTTAILLAVMLSPFATRSFAAPARAGGPVTFGPSSMVDDQRLAGEPDVKVCGPTSTWSYGNCGLDNPYASAPYGFSTTSSFVWRSEDKAKTFKLAPSNSTTGKPDACPGGGDTDLAVSPSFLQRFDFLNFVDLQGLTNFSTGISSNGGKSFSCNPASSTATVVDRQWFGIDKNPTSNGSIVYLDYDVATGAACINKPNHAGNTFVVQSSTNRGFSFAPPVIADCNDGIAGNMQVNQKNGHVFAIHTGYTSASAPAADSVVLNKSTDHGATWSRSIIFQPTAGISCPTECTTGQDFAVLAIDKSGGLYAVWSQAPVDANGAITGPSHIFYAYSANEGKSWTPEKQVDSGTTDVNVFPWIAAGNAGAIDVVWYGTTKASGATSYDPGAQISDWYPYLAQSLNANGPAATFSAPVAVSQHPNHNGGICTMGLGCTTGGDRSLADFFQVDVNKQGGADVVWADTSNNGNNGSNQAGLIDEARQIAGPTLFGSSLSGTAPNCTAVGVTPCQTDQKGDAHYEANGLIGVNVPKLDITGSSVNIDPANHAQLDVQLRVANLSSLPNPTDPGIMDPFVDYLTSWNYHIPGGTQATYDSTGNIYYAYLEVNKATGAVTAFDGNTCSIASTHPKFLVYPGQHSIVSHINNAKGTIDLYVPLADVGNPAAGSSLYSVTGHTVGQTAAAGPYDCSTRDPNGNNDDPTGQIFNVYDKSQAYASVLTTP